MARTRWSLGAVKMPGLSLLPGEGGRPWAAGLNSGFAQTEPGSPANRQLLAWSLLPKHRLDKALGKPTPWPGRGLQPPSGPL